MFIWADLQLLNKLHKQQFIAGESPIPTYLLLFTRKQTTCNYAFQIENKLTLYFKVIMYIELNVQ